MTSKVVCFTGMPEALAAFRGDPEIELAVWTRKLPLCLESWLMKLPPEQFPDGRVLVEPRQARAAIADVFEGSRTSAGFASELLMEDIASLVEQFAVALDEDLVDIRLEAIAHDACWKFHRDRVPGRLVTTYRGATTQWIEDRDAEEALRLQRDFQGPIHQLEKHAVGLFRGSCASPARGVVHRSPPIAGAGEVRLFLCLNPPSGASPEPYAR